ncbi:MAG TPA: hypothetical protein PKJ19_01420, partial [Flavobacteriales bacterium]|nr:hypothetical protein [Flavobacteriales bacterium]
MRRVREFGNDHTLSGKDGTYGGENTESPGGAEVQYCGHCPIAYFCGALVPAEAVLTDGVTGNTSDFGSEESRF